VKARDELTCSKRTRRREVAMTRFATFMLLALLPSVVGCATASPENTIQSVM
jgi:hypothetical protein